MAEQTTIKPDIMEFMAQIETMSACELSEFVEEAKRVLASKKRNCCSAAEGGKGGYPRN